MPPALATPDDNDGRLSISQHLGDRFIRHNVNLLRLEASERRVVLKMLKGLENEIVARLLKTEGLTLAETRKLEALFVATEEMIRTAYKDIGIEQRASLIKIGEFESEHTKTLVNQTVGVSLMTVGVPLTTIKALVDGDIVLGLPAKDWWAKQATNLKAAFQDTMRRGVFAGETLNELARRVRGTRESGFRDGIMGGATRGARRNAEALIRTSAQSILGAARDETLRANDDVIAGQEWLTTLDPRTCVICMALSGQAWDFDGNPIGDTTEAFPGPPPRHFNCRCSLVPLLKSWEQLAKDAGGNEKLARKLDRIEKKIGAGTQASMDGQIAADVDYDTWLKGRRASEQKEILGPSKWALWKKGKIGLTDLVSQTGRPLTLAELQQAS